MFNYSSLLGCRGTHPPTILVPPSSSSINNPTFPFSTGRSSCAGVRGGRGGFGLNSSSNGEGDAVDDARPEMKLGFGGTTGFGLAPVLRVLARRGGGSCGDGGSRSDCCRRGGGAGAVLGGVFFSGTKCPVGILIQSDSVVGSNGFVGLFGLSCHPSPGGFGISTLDDAL
jgi:hypothetical protein